MHLIDELGALKAAISSMRETEDRLKAQLISLAAQHPGKVWAENGDVFRATVSWADKTVTDWKAVAATLAQQHDTDPDVLARLIKANTQKAEMVPSVRVGARKVEA